MIHYDDFALQYYEFLLLLVGRRLALKNKISGCTIEDPSSPILYLGQSRIEKYRGYFPTGTRDPELEADHATVSRVGSMMCGATPPGLLQGLVLGHRDFCPNYNDVLF